MHTYYFSSISHLRVIKQPHGRKVWKKITIIVISWSKFLT